MNTKNNSATARVERPHRSQVEMRFFALDQLLSPDHRVRVVWAFIEIADPWDAENTIRSSLQKGIIP